jgi:phosphatidylserine decarboxylase
MKIHREGYPTIGIVLLVISLLNFLTFQFVPIYFINILISIISIVFLYLILHFFRDPIRNISINDQHIIAPSDGKLVVIENVIENEFLKEECTQLSIFMSPLNVHKQWYPTNGQVVYSKYHPGKYLVAWHPKSSTENERSTIVIKNKDNNILYRQIAGAVARRICNYAIVGSEVNQSMEAGFIKFGSRIDVFVPKSSKIKVTINDTIIGGKTILAEL